MALDWTAQSQCASSSFNTTNYLEGPTTSKPQNKNTKHPQIWHLVPAARRGKVVFFCVSVRAWRKCISDNVPKDNESSAFLAAHREFPVSSSIDARDPPNKSGK